MAAGDLTTVDDVKAYANVKTDQDDELLGKLVTGASAFVKNWLGRELHEATESKRFDGTGGSVLIMPSWPVTAVPALSINGQAIAPAASPGASGYEFDADAVWVNGYVLTRGRRNVAITWTAGYAATAIPRTIQHAVMELVVLIYRDRDRVGVVSKSMAGETTSYFQGVMTRRVESMLQQHKKVAPC